MATVSLGASFSAWDMKVEQLPRDFIAASHLASPNRFLPQGDRASTNAAVKQPHKEFCVRSRNPHCVGTGAEKGLLQRGEALPRSGRSEQSRGPKRALPFNVALNTRSAFGSEARTPLIFDDFGPTLRGPLGRFFFSVVGAPRGEL